MAKLKFAVVKDPMTCSRIAGWIAPPFYLVGFLYHKHPVGPDSGTPAPHLIRLRQTHKIGGSAGSGDPGYFPSRVKKRRVTAFF
jgi:hypothetical protein